MAEFQAQVTARILPRSFSRFVNTWSIVSCGASLAKRSSMCFDVAVPRLGNFLYLSPFVMY